VSARHLTALVAGVLAVAALQAAPAGATTKQFCAAYKSWDLLYAEQFVAGTPSDQQIAAVDDRLDALVTRLERTAPKRIAADVQTIADRFHAGFAQVVSALRAGDGKLGDAFYAVDNFALNSCDFRVVDVTAADFRFRGVPKSIAPGFVAFAVGNDSPQDHFMMIVRLTGRKTVEDLTTLSFSELVRAVEVVAPPTVAPPGRRVANYAQLEKPGRYAIVDPTFLTEKMATEFRVTNAHA
jgi:hypothetical protein